jgi:hypothetical protein
MFILAFLLDPHPFSFSGPSHRQTNAAPEWQAGSLGWRSKEFDGCLLTDNLCGDTFLQCLLSQGIEALTLSLCCHRQPFMELGRNPEVELT